jgi:NDP-sugar pyrophosphorylase family protein
MKSEISVFVLAAGMGSRYGGLKQMEGFGPKGETIIDYSIYDAIRAGFDRVVFVIRPDMEEAFREVFLHKYQDKIDIDYCFQTVDMLPDWYERDPKRTKPWGTGHAVLVSRDIIGEPFVVISGDDFYGRKAFEKAAEFLRNECKAGYYGIPTYKLKNVLSDVGTVKRGVCFVTNGLLERIEETYDIEKDKDGTIAGRTWDGKLRNSLKDNTPISMAIHYFHPDIYERLGKGFEEFLKDDPENDREFILTEILSKLTEKGEIQQKAIEISESWFGVTHHEDAKIVRKKLRELVDKGEYPEHLWD